MSDLEAFDVRRPVQLKQALELLALPLNNLIAIAEQVKNLYALKLEMCSIISFKTGLCSENCSFCAQSSYFNTGINFHKADVESIVKKAKIMKDYGVKRFSIVSSGRGPSANDLDDIIRILDRLKSEVDIELCASLGIIGEKGLQLLKNYGLSTYHHNLESSRSFFNEVCTSHSYEERLETIKAVKSVGLMPCVGGIIGMGESFEQRIELAFTLKELGIKSVPFNMLIPIKGTKFDCMQSISRDEVLRTLAIFRIILPDATIRLCAGRENVLGEDQFLALKTCANAIMVGGYLTTPGAEIDKDMRLIKLLNAPQ